MVNFDKETIALKYGARMYDYIQHKIKDNKKCMLVTKMLNKDTTHIEIDIESAEFALGLRDDRPKLHEFVEKLQKQKYYQQGKIDGIKEFARELKKHSCSYDLEEWMDFDAVNVEVIDTVMNDCINKILADTTESEE